jgi:glutathione S-transferase
MKLTFSPNSPYVRKVMVLALELGLADRIERVPTSLSLYDPNPTVTALNPLCKIPVLSTDDGENLFDSIVICEYLSALAGDSQWFPAAGARRWAALRTNAVADGMLEAAQLSRAESTRPAGVRYDQWAEVQLGKVTRGIAYLDAHLPSENDIGGIAVVCALGWLDFRFAGLGWRQTAPRLAAWLAQFETRPSVQATGHPA